MPMGGSTPRPTKAPSYKETVKENQTLADQRQFSLERALMLQKKQGASQLRGNSKEAGTQYGR